LGELVPGGGFLDLPQLSVHSIANVFVQQVGQVFKIRLQPTFPSPDVTRRAVAESCSTAQTDPQKVL
jgi:hypothetical protein